MLPPTSEHRGDPVGGERVIGTYLYPYRLLTEPVWDNAESATEIVATCGTAASEVLITRNGGLFVRPPSTFSDPYQRHTGTPFSDFDAKVAFERMAAALFNALICEFAVLGIVSEPATPVHISRGLLTEGRITVRGGGGGREIYLERSLGPGLELHSGMWRMHPVVPRNTVEKATREEVASSLKAASETLPALVAGAYSAHSKGLLAEAIVDSWIVVEQLIDWYWENRRNALVDGQRRSRLADTRTYSVAVRIELLQTSDVLPSALSQQIHVARRYRNDLAHRAQATHEGADACMLTMCDVLRFFSGREVIPPGGNVSISW